MLHLKQFRVTNFRSVEDSGWITTDAVTALIGTNESGKTNLLIPLWKLNPAKDGEINPISDYPRSQYNKIREMAQKPIFIQAYFELSDDIASVVADIASIDQDDINIVHISRDFDGRYTIDFPTAAPKRNTNKQTIQQILSETHTDITNMNAIKSEENIKSSLLDAISNAIETLQQAPEELTVQNLTEIQNVLISANTNSPSKRSTIIPRFDQLRDVIEETLSEITNPHPKDITEIQNIIIDNLPKFVYYSNYGNLDSEIYLPHVIENMQRKNLGSKEESKVRTLKVLFEFVRLKPSEILDLGRDFDVVLQNRQPTEEEIKDITLKKKKRDILLQSASTELTQSFRSWWRQGDYRFRFGADGNHFLIWVSDDKRTEEIELEGRSTGLQWFLSFYLIFLVESSSAHKGAILLLDEPGLSLHPLAQKDLSAFFEGLSKTNQLIYTTHSPFLVDPNHLDRVKAVYVNENGSTSVATDLRAKEVNPAQSHSIYPVHAALGLSVSDILLQGCRPVIVEGPSDQIYLSAIKNYLISKGLIKLANEIIFVPSKGTRGVSAVVSILTGKDENLPYVLLDSDKDGRQTAKQLKELPYVGAQNRIIMTSDICGMPDSEVEDLIPVKLFSAVVSRYIRSQDEDFEDLVEEDKPIVSQIEEFARRNSITLPPGWKVEIAKLVKSRLQKEQSTSRIPESTITTWQTLFSKIEN